MEEEKRGKCVIIDGRVYWLTELKDDNSGYWIACEINKDGVMFRALCIKVDEYQKLYELTEAMNLINDTSAETPAKAEVTEWLERTLQSEEDISRWQSEQLKNITQALSEVINDVSILTNQISKQIRNIKHKDKLGKYVLQDGKAYELRGVGELDGDYFATEILPNGEYGGHFRLRYPVNSELDLYSKEQALEKIR